MRNDKVVFKYDKGNMILEGFRVDNTKVCLQIGSKFEGEDHYKWTFFDLTPAKLSKLSNFLNKQQQRTRMLAKRR